MIWAAFIVALLVAVALTIGVLADREKGKGSE